MKSGHSKLDAWGEFGFVVFPVVVELIVLFSFHSLGYASTELGYETMFNDIRDEMSSVKSRYDDTERELRETLYATFAAKSDPEFWGPPTPQPVSEVDKNEQNRVKAELERRRRTTEELEKKAEVIRKEFKEIEKNEQRKQLCKEIEMNARPRSDKEIETQTHSEKRRTRKEKKDQAEETKVEDDDGNPVRRADMDDAGKSRYDGMDRVGGHQKTRRKYQHQCQPHNP